MHSAGASNIKQLKSFNRCLRCSHPCKQHRRLCADHPHILVRLHNLHTRAPRQECLLRTMQVLELSATNSQHHLCQLQRQLWGPRAFLMRASGSWWFLNSAGSVPTCTIS